MTSSRRSFWPRDQAQVSCIDRQILYQWATQEGLSLCLTSCGNTSLTEVGPSSYSRMTSSYLIIPEITLFPNKSHSVMLGIRTSTYLSQGHNSVQEDHLFLQRGISFNKLGLCCLRATGICFLWTILVARFSVFIKQWYKKCLKEWHGCVY